jgi:hypothetical protein
MRFGPPVSRRSRISKFVFEGEEEVGSPNLEKILAANKGGNGIEDQGLQLAPIRARFYYGYLAHLEPLNRHYR